MSTPCSAASRQVTRLGRCSLPLRAPHHPSCSPHPSFRAPSRRATPRERGTDLISRGALAAAPRESGWPGETRERRLIPRSLAPLSGTARDNGALLVSTRFRGTVTSGTRQRQVRRFERLTVPNEWAIGTASAKSPRSASRARDVPDLFSPSRWLREISQSNYRERLVTGRDSLLTS